MAQHDIVVIGASAGGISAVRTIISSLPADFPGSIFVVIHTTEDNPGRLPDLLNRRSQLPVSFAVDDTPITPGRVYVARPGRHLVIDRGRVKLTLGPRENRHRPAVDVLFRSAAATYGPRVVGIVLTGNLDDGTLGLSDIKDRGGLAIVQDPEDAFAPSMPRSALEFIEPDYVLPLGEIGPQLTRLAVSSLEQPEVVQFGKQPQNGNKAEYSCPECGGVLQEYDTGDVVKFKCRVGHSYAPESLAEDQADYIERALWAAVRSLEEHEQFCARLARRFQKKNLRKLAERFSDRASASRENAGILRELLEHAEAVRRETQEEEDATGTA